MDSATYNCRYAMMPEGNSNDRREWEQVRTYAREQGVPVTRDGNYGFNISATNVAGGNPKTKAEPVKFTNLTQAKNEPPASFVLIRAGGF
jgi:hypothetical protein